MSLPPLEIVDLGTLPYRQALALQTELVARRQADEIPDQLLLLEHPKVFSYGRRNGTAHLLATPAELARRGIELVETDRGGDITYHGPGQLVGYLIARLEGPRRSVPWLFEAIEGAITQLLRDRGLDAQPGTRAAGKAPQADLREAGVWIGNDKICAVGLRLSRWVSKHGFALNICPDLEDYQLVTACGLAHRGVTSMARQMNLPPTVEALKEPVSAALASRLGRTARRVLASSLDTSMSASI